MREITQIERIRLSQFLVDVLEGVDAAMTGNHPEALAKINIFIPKLVANITYSTDGCTKEPTTSTRYFTYLHHKFKGKKRVYVSMDRFKNDLYIFYLSSERIHKLCTDPHNAKWISEIIGNRWLLTLGSHKFKDEYQLLGHLIAAELNVSRSNKPAPQVGVAWRSIDTISQLVSRYRDIGNPYHIAACSVHEFNMTRMCDQFMT